MRIYAGILYVASSTYENVALRSATLACYATLAPFLEECRDPLWHHHVTRVLCLSVIRSNKLFYEVIGNVAE